MAKINISIPDDLLAITDELSEKSYMSRSGFVAQALRTYIDTMKFNNMLDELTKAIKRIGIDGNDDKETVSEVNNLLACLSILQQKDK